MTTYKYLPYRYLPHSIYTKVFADLTNKQVDNLIMEDLLILCQDAKFCFLETNALEDIPSNAFVISDDGLFFKD